MNYKRISKFKMINKSIIILLFMGLKLCIFHYIKIIQSKYHKQ